jgi:hypothetical protein
MAVKESIGTMLDQVAAGDKSSAESTFNEILASKVSAALENLKVDAADQMFNVQKEETDLDEGVGRMLGAPGTPRGDHNSAILRKGAAGPGQKSIKSTGYSGGQSEPTVSWESVRTGRKFKDEASANADHDGKD